MLAFFQYLDKIGQLFFGLPPPAPSMSGIGGLFGEFDILRVQPFSMTKRYLSLVQGILLDSIRIM